MDEPSEQESAQTSADEPSDEAAVERIVGTWQGALEVSGAELTIVFNLDRADGSWQATMDSPDQGATGIPISEVHLDGDRVRLLIPSIQGSYEGTLSDDAQRIDGDWTQGPQSLPLDVERVEEAEGVSRPQHPEPPYPYAVEEVEFAGGEATQGTDQPVRLAGTLTLPESDGPHPAIVLITGSGPQDRDETIAGHKPFLVLADHLTRQGVAVLRYDDRGVGASTGSFEGATIADFTNDAVAAVEFLGERADIDADNIGLLGHSEGANVAARSASKTSASQESDTVAFTILLAPTAVPGHELLARQNALVFEGLGMSEQGAQAYEQAMLDALEQLMQVPLDQPVSDEVEEQLRADFKAAAEAMSPGDRAVYGPTDPQAFESVLDTLVEQLTTAWMRSFLTMQPAETLEKLDVPTLAVFGGQDVQVPDEQNAPVLRQLLADKEDASIEVLEGLNHLFQPAHTGLPGEYAAISTTIDPSLFESIDAWLAEQNVMRR